MIARRRRRSKPKAPSRQLLISATDGEWETVGAHADRRGLSKAAYLTALAARDVAGGPAGPPLVMNRDEQHAVVEALRELRRGLAGGGDTPALIADIQVRIATMFDVWARDLVARGKRDALLHALASTTGEDQARALVASLKKAATRPPARDEKEEEEEEEDGPDLFSWSREA